MPRLRPTLGSGRWFDLLGWRIAFERTGRQGWHLSRIGRQWYWLQLGAWHLEVSKPEIAPPYFPHQMELETYMERKEHDA